MVWYEAGSFFWIATDTYLQKWDWSGSAFSRSVNYDWSADWSIYDPQNLAYDADRDLIIAASANRLNLYDVSTTPSRTYQGTVNQTYLNMEYDETTQTIYTTGFDSSGFDVNSFDASDETNVTSIQSLFVSSTYVQENLSNGGHALV